MSNYTFPSQEAPLKSCTPRQKLIKQARSLGVAAHHNPSSASKRKREDTLKIYVRGLFDAPKRYAHEIRK